MLTLRKLRGGNHMKTSKMGRHTVSALKRRGMRRNTRGWHTDVSSIFKPLPTQSCFVFLWDFQNIFFHFISISILSCQSHRPLAQIKIFPSCFQTTRNDGGQTQVLTVHHASWFELRSSSPNEETLTPKMKGAMGRLVFTPQFQNTAPQYLR